MTDSKCDHTTPVIERKTYSVLEIAKILGIGKNKAYELCNSDLFKVIRVGKSLRVVKQSFDTWLDGGGN